MRVGVRIEQVNGRTLKALEAGGAWWCTTLPEDLGGTHRLPIDIRTVQRNLENPFVEWYEPYKRKIAQRKQEKENGVYMCCDVVLCVAWNTKVCVCVCVHEQLET